MNTHELLRGWIAGLWKFRSDVPLDELIAVACELSRDTCYLQVYVRKVSKDQNGIGFVYTPLAGMPAEFSERTKKEQDRYFEKTSDFLKRRFGNGLVGWDIDSPIYHVLCSGQMERAYPGAK